MFNSAILLIQNPNKHNEYENPLSIYGNVDYLQIM